MGSAAQVESLAEEHGRHAIGRPEVVPRLLRTSEAARYLGMGDKAIRQLIVRGELPYVQMKPGNSPFLLDRRDLDRFIEMHKIPAGRQ